MNQEVQFAPGRFDLGEDRVHAVRVGDVAGKNQRRLDAFGQWADALFQGIALIGETQGRTMRRGGLGYSPRDRTVVRDPHDQALLALHQRCSLAHSGSSWVDRDDVA